MVDISGYGDGGPLATKKAYDMPTQADPNVTPRGAHATMDGQAIFNVQNEREWAMFCRDVLKNLSLNEADIGELHAAGAI